MLMHEEMPDTHIGAEPSFTQPQPVAACAGEPAMKAATVMPANKIKVLRIAVPLKIARGTTV